MKAERRTNLIERVKALQGLTDDERGDLLELLRSNKAYGLVWENHREDVEERLRDELPVLVEDETKRLNDGGNDAPNHVLIEGDNLEALTALAYTHAGKIDVIYIDPPYNTGNKDFIYNDSFVDSEDSYRHSKWLSFMNKRLRIAKKLLSDRGVIFISIDDNEQANLKLLCDEIFGFNSFMGNISWQRTYSPRNDKKGIVRETEYIMVYTKSDDWQPYKLERTAEMDAKYKNPDNDFAPWTSGDAFAPDSKQHQGMVYAVQHPFTGELIYPYAASHWRYHQDDMLQIMNGWAPYKLEDIRDEAKRADICGISADEVRGNVKAIILAVPFEEARLIAQKVLERGQWPKFYFTKGGKGGIRRKTYLEQVEGKLPTNLWMYEDVGHTDEAKKEIKRIFDSKAPFDTPKPVRLLKRILKISSQPASTILDFFAGSGTTLHAVMQLNAEDGGKRKCILVTNNENGICENVTYERNKRVINGYTKPNGDAVEGLHANNLRYYRTAFVGRDTTPQNLRKLVRLATDMLCIKENLYSEQTEFAGQEVVKQVFRYFGHGNKRMLVIYREEAVPLIVPLIEKFDLPKGERIHVYVFSPSEDPWAGDFENVQHKVELCALPMAILNAYKRVLPKRTDRDIFVKDETDDNEFGGLFAAEGGDQ